MAKQIYSFTKVKKNETKAGIYATIIGIIALISIAVLFVMAIKTRGNISIRLGGLGFISIVLSAFGLYLARSAKKDSDIFGSMIKPGIIINSIVLIFDIVVFFIGLFMIIS